MTGTGSSSSGELKRIYNLRVVPIPTNRPAIREKLPAKIFGTAEAKWAAIVREVLETHAQGRPILIGTRSIDKSIDIYALGIVAYELFTGRVPFSADTPVAVLMKQASEPIVWPLGKL